MGIQKRETVYVSDRGDEYVLSEMQTNHLLNVFTHHSKQREALVQIRDAFGLPAINLDRQIIQMDVTLNAIATEIASRDPEDDDRPRPTPRNRHDY